MSLKAKLEEIRINKQQVLVVGLGISGIESAKFLNKIGIKVVCVEKSSEASYRQKSKWLGLLQELVDLEISINFGIDGEGLIPFLDQVELAVLSPGVSLESSIVGALNRHAIPVIGELELGIEYSGLPAIVVTGSNGKSTTVSLLKHILKTAGKNAILCGNVGTPVVSQIADEINKEGILVVEASSYQLETCTMLKPKVAVLLNISDNHLERHGTIERYVDAKAKMFALQDKTDFTVLNADDPIVAAQASGLNSQVLKFGIKTSLSDKQAEIDYRPAESIDLVRTTLEYDLSRCKLIGRHNKANIAAAILVCEKFGVSKADMLKAIDSFKTLEHRIEEVANNLDRLIINDTKSTTVASSVAAFRASVEKYPDKKISLLLGGRAKAGSWEPVFKIIKESQQQINQIIFFGEDRNMLAKLCEVQELAFVKAPKVAEALKLALETSNSGDLILFSPGCASFDEFGDFEERGNMFKSYVKAYEAASTKVANNV
ncbi:MAG: UDP-N-acetylmuramoyl-L-alanine--D-glutamate ligase [Bdellovibrionota bacterium]